MDTLFNTHFDSTPSTHDLPGVKLKASTYGKFWGFLFYGGGVKGVGDNNTVHNVNEHYILKDETIKEYLDFIFMLGVSSLIEYSNALYKSGVDTVHIARR